MAIKTFFADTRELSSSFWRHNEFVDEQARDAFVRDFNEPGCEVFRVGEKIRQCNFLLANNGAFYCFFVKGDNCIRLPESYLKDAITNELQAAFTTPELYDAALAELQQYNAMMRKHQESYYSKPWI